VGWPAAEQTGPQRRFAALLAELLEGLGRPVPEGARDPVMTWLGAVAQWNRKLDLTAARDDRELVDLMVADAALLAGELRQGASVVDVGSGAGAPGLPLGLLRPDLRLTLVEPRQKRAAFLRTVLGGLAAERAARMEPGVARPPALAAASGAEGVAPPRPALAAEVLQLRAEQLARHDFDAALSRATLTPAAWLERGAALAPAGEVWVLLAREPAPEREGWALERELSYRWPLTGAERRAGCYRPSQG
jgi:16S rRNA (guanine527-N7)-methyltransferase